MFAPKALILLLVLFVAACENEPELVYAPLPPAPVVQWGFPADDSPPVCGGADLVELDEEQGEQLCRWSCAYFWTQDGNIGPRRYEKTFVREPDGWGSYQGQFWATCDAGSYGFTTGEESGP